MAIFNSYVKLPEGMTYYTPYVPCMVYLPTFGWFLGYMLVKIPYMEHLGTTIIVCFDHLSSLVVCLSSITYYTIVWYTDIPRYTHTMIGSTSLVVVHLSGVWNITRKATYGSLWWNRVVLLKVGSSFDPYPDLSGKQRYGVAMIDYVMFFVDIMIASVVLSIILHS